MFAPDVFSGGLLQPPVRMMPQPQPVRRIEPPPRFPNRIDRGPELILRPKEERRSGNAAHLVQLAGALVTPSSAVFCSSHT